MLVVLILVLVSRFLWLVWCWKLLGRFRCRNGCSMFLVLSSLVMLELVLLVMMLFLRVIKLLWCCVSFSSRLWLSGLMKCMLMIVRLSLWFIFLVVGRVLLNVSRVI